MTRSPFARVKPMLSRRFASAYAEAHNAKYGLMILATTIAGHIPSHSLRGVVYRMAGVDFHTSTIVYWGGRWFKPDGVRIGRNSIVGDHFFLDGRRGVKIGDNVNIASEVRIWTEQHDTADENFSVVGAPVVIEDWAFVGSRVTILPGVTIGEGAVIGAGAVVTKDVNPWTVAVGVPARAVRARPVVRYTLQTTKKFWFQ